MIKQSAIFFSFLLSSITLPAAANPGWFGTIGVGLNSPGDIDASTNYFGTKYLGTEKLDGGFSGEIGFGYDFGNIRTEFTYNSTTSSLTVVDGLDVSSKSLRKNANEFSLFISGPKSSTVMT